MLGFTRHVLHSYYGDEFDIFVVYGTPAGIGKSSYCIKALSEVKDMEKQGESKIKLVGEEEKPL